MIETIVRHGQVRIIVAAKAQDPEVTVQTAEERRMTADLRAEIRAAVWKLHLQRK